MKPVRHILLLLLLILPSINLFSAPTRIYILPIDMEIGSTTWRFVHSGLEEARRENADMILVHLNTYGGEVSAADSIRTALMRYPAPVVALVDNNAASAGALIALACDTVYMVPGASMGAATVVSGSDGTAMPDKYQSYMRAMMRATAERHGRVSDGDSTRWRRDPLIAEAMVDSRVIVPGLIDSTKVLTFTTDEAIHWHYADGSARDIPDMLSQLGIDDYTTTSFTPSWIDHLIGFLTHPGFKAILITLIMLGIYWELQTPGVGFPLTVAIIAALLYFLPLFLGGEHFSPWIALLFALGAILLILEIFVIPGFGIAGIAGITAMACALIWGLAESLQFSAPHLPDNDMGRSFLSALSEAILWFFGALAVTIGISVWLTSKRGPKILTRTTELTHSQDIDKGYIGVDMSIADMIGRSAVTVTPLRPSGKIAIDGEQYDAVAIGGFINAGKRVVVKRHSGAQLYVTAEP